MNLKEFLVILLFSFFVASCSSNKNLTSEFSGELAQKLNASLNQVVEDKVQVINTYLTNGSELNKEFMEFDSIYLDSISQVFKTLNQVLIEKNKPQYVKLLMDRVGSDTIDLANINGRTLKKQEPTTYTYSVKKGDLISYEFENEKSKIINSFEIKTGDIVRVLYADIRRNNPVRGQFEALNNDEVSFIIRKKGFFSSKFRLESKLVLQKERISVSEVTDSVPYFKKVIETVKDTLFSSVQPEIGKIGSVLDITSSNTKYIDVNFPKEEGLKLIGWSYWIGFGLDSSVLYEEAQSSDINGDPLKTFVLSEISKDVMPYKFPFSVPTDISLRVKLNGNFRKSLNSKLNYGLFISESSESSGPLGSLIVNNVSKLQEFPFSLRLMAIYSRSSKKEILKQFYAEKPFFRIMKTIRDED
jgi:hypothetical protein